PRQLDRGRALHAGDAGRGARGRHEGPRARRVARPPGRGRTDDEDTEGAPLLRPRAPVEPRLRRYAAAVLDDRVRAVLARLDAEKQDYARLFELARDKVEPGGLVIADNVLSHADGLAAYSEARQADPTLESVTVPLDRGLEVSVVLRSVR